MKPLARMAAALALCAACAGAPKPPPRSRRLMGPQARQGRGCGAGLGRPGAESSQGQAGRGRLLPASFWPQDAIDAACRRPRRQARARAGLPCGSARIDSATAKANGGATISKEATDVVMQNSRIEATWVDASGERSDPVASGVASLEIESIRGKAQPASETAAGKAAQGGTDRPGSTGCRRPGPGSTPPATRARPTTPRTRSSTRATTPSTTWPFVRAHVQAYTLLVENASGLTVDQFAQTLEDPTRRSAESCAGARGWRTPGWMRKGSAPAIRRAPSGRSRRSTSSPARAG